MSDDSSLPSSMSAEQRYRFDINGYLVVEDVLDDTTIAELNDLVDEQNLPEPTAETGSGRRFGKFLEWGEPFRNLLDHADVLPILRDLLGDGLRFDHYYGIYMDHGGETLPLHGGGTPYDPAQYYHCKAGEPFSGLTVVSWNLTDTGVEQGGFCCIPGSHRANYDCPESITNAVATAESPAELPNDVVVPEAPTGSAVIFTEALTHGTAPWVADHQRRTLLFKYSPGHQSWANEYLQPPDGIPFTNRQEGLFEPPYVQDRSSSFQK